MPERVTRVLLDQNVPQECAVWLRNARPGWEVWHVNQTALTGRPDAEVFQWAQARRAMVVSYDEDFADARSFPLGAHYGIIRLRVWPTTTEMTIAALQRVLQSVPEADLQSSLIIVDNKKIRLRRSKQSTP
jgi:predicted nuclease of predicted toxin-antitoxin system